MSASINQYYYVNDKQLGRLFELKVGWFILLTKQIFFCSIQLDIFMGWKELQISWCIIFFAHCLSILSSLTYRQNLLINLTDTIAKNDYFISYQVFCIYTWLPCPPNYQFLLLLLSTTIFVIHTSNPRMFLLHDQTVKLSLPLYVKYLID